MIDPNKMEAFANSGSSGRGEEEPDDEMEETPGEGPDQKMAPLIPMLEEFSDDIMDCCDELDPDMLDDMSSEMSPEDNQILKEGIQNLDRKLQKTLQSVASKGISEDEARYVGDHLESEGAVDDGQRLAGWLFRVGQTFSGGEPPSDEEGNEEEGPPGEGEGGD